MIKANELRIGNWVLISGHLVKVCGTSSEGISLEYGDKFKFEHIQPVPLTPEIFIKSGFKSNNKAPFSIGRFCIYSLGDGYLFEWEKKDDAFGNPATNFKYVHELQNLYAALTGEELSIDI